MRRRMVRVGLAAGLLALLGWGAITGLADWRLRGELRRARAEIDRGRFEPARRRLASLSATRPGALGGRVDYWLGVCESARGRPDAALAAFARVPTDFPFEPTGAYHEARANLERGRLRAAERRLSAALAGATGQGRDDLRALLVRVLEVQVRFRDAADLVRAGLGESKDPLRTLGELADLDRGSLPLEGLRASLDEAERMAPDDDRVWLGRARLAIQEGRWDEARARLRRCLDREADAAVWRAQLDWARGSGRPAEAIEAARQLGDSLGPADRLDLRAWIFEQAGDAKREAEALNRLVAIRPGNARALERLAELAHQSGDPGRRAEFRRRKEEVDHALERYRERLEHPEVLLGAADRLEMGRVAETLGRWPEARAWDTLALKVEPENSEALAALARLDRREVTESGEAKSSGDPWADLAAIVRPTGASKDNLNINKVQFIDDAEAVGLRFVYRNGQTPLHQLPEPLGGGVALLDYDGDGWLDVYAVQGGAFPPETGSAGLPPSPLVGEGRGGGANDADPRSPHPNPPPQGGRGPDPDEGSVPGARPPGDRLFRNRGDGTFEDVTDASGLGGYRGYGHGVTAGDFDNDGNPDLFVTRWRSYALYRNRGDGTFEDATESAGLGGDRDWPTSAAFADLDNDGDLDLYVCHYAEWDPAHPKLCRDRTTDAYISCNPLESPARPDHLFRNDGGRFADISAEAGINNRDGRGLGVVAADLDDDGKIDLYVANDMTANFLWRNLGGLRFEEAAQASGVAGNAEGGYQAGMGVACGDLDGDGRPDLAVTNFYGEATTLYRNLGGGVFADRSLAAGLTAASRHLLGFGLALLDVNNDGRLDLASANGHVNDFRPNFPYTMPAQLLVADPSGRLVDISDRAGPPWRVLRMGRGLAEGDLDNDGRMDLLVLSHNQPLAYFHNRTDPRGHFVTLRLEGTRSNRDGNGARVAILAGGRRLHARRNGGGSYQSSGDPRLHLGLGDADRIDEIEIHWPSGRVDRHRDLRADTGYLLREGQPSPAPLGGFPHAEESTARPDR